MEVKEVGYGVLRRNIIDRTRGTLRVWEGSRESGENVQKGKEQQNGEGM